MPEINTHCLVCAATRGNDLEVSGISVVEERWGPCSRQGKVLQSSTLIMELTQRSKGVMIFSEEMPSVVHHLADIICVPADNAHPMIATLQATGGCCVRFVDD